MQFTHDKLIKIEEKLKITKINANYFNLLHDEFKNDRFKNRYERMTNCLDFWVWDKYEMNKVLDLQRVNCCKDRFCPNCCSLAINRNIVKFAPKFAEMVNKGYNPYLMTLTVPNVCGDSLKSTVDKLIKSFSKFWRWVYKDKGRDGGYKNRLFDCKGCIKGLEITVQKDNNDMYHPHLHLLVFIENDNADDFHKYIDGGYQRNSGTHIKYSDSDIHIMKLWYLAFNNLSINKYDSLSDNWFDLYICDVRPMSSPEGIYEVFKYTFKDSDIKNFNNFKTIFFSIEGKRLRQGHGELFNLKVDDEVENGEEYESILDYLLVDEKEEPQRQHTKAIEDLRVLYQDYIKISRFRNWKDIDNIK